MVRRDTGAIDRAVAGLLTTLTLVVAHLAGIPGEFLHLATRLL